MKYMIQSKHILQVLTVYYLIIYSQHITLCVDKCLLVWIYQTNSNHLTGKTFLLFTTVTHMRKRT